MTRPNAVQHPLEPSALQVDFWGWRRRRRAAVDALRALALAPATGLEAAELATAAERLEMERLDEDHAAALAAQLGAVAGVAVTSTLDLTNALQILIERYGLTVRRPWPLPLLRPDWHAIPVTRLAPLFVGRIDGVPLRARTPEHRGAVPPYRIHWTGSHGTEHGPVPLAGLTAGPHWAKLPGLWDWLLARRLTILCQTGVAPWPAEAGGPLASPVDWPAPVRPI